MMEESPGLCIDPEEDEIFFYGINDKELKATPKEKSVQLEMHVSIEHRSDENKQIFEDAAVNIEPVNSGNDVKTADKIEHVPDTKLAINSSNMAVVVAEGSLKICENTKEKPNVLIDQTNNQECDENESKEVESTNMPVLKREIKNEIYQNNSIHDDHNYSTPVKTVIDKSILKTPKSVVKADKDGGFLKVLSEIALVKAEVDENTFNDASVLSNISPKKEMIYDDNKENDICDVQNIGSKKLNEGRLIKLEDSIVNKSHNENQDEKLSGCNKTQNGDVFFATDCKNLKHSETTAEEQTLDEKDISTCKSNTINNDSDDLQVTFENIVTHVGKVVKEEENEVVGIRDTIKLEEGQESDGEHVENPMNKGVKEFPIKIIPEIKVRNASLPGENNEEEEEGNYNSLQNVISSEEERLKKFLKRRTMNLLQELSEIVSHEQVKRESSGVNYPGLSEESAKVIEKLKQVELDDSIMSPNQYFDLDNLSETFLSTELTDILNDTLSKPLDLLTKKDIELLLEKINCTSLEDKLPSQTEIVEVLDAEKENLCQNTVQETVNRKLESSENRDEKTLNSKVYAPSSQRKCTPVRKCLFESKKMNHTPIAQSQTNQNALRAAGCRTAGHGMKANVDTRIPKLTSTVSKIPIKGSRDGQVQGRTPVLNKTPYHKAAKSLKFNNIKSPVQAYINAKVPVLISNVKGKPETGFNVWMKDVASETKTAKPSVENKIVKNTPKTNLPFVKYRSAIPLKLEKSPESRLPRLAPKMQKLILGNSPVIAKHEGRIKLKTTCRPQVSTNESSIMLNPNEVSVIVKKVALNSNIKK